MQQERKISPIDIGGGGVRLPLVERQRKILPRL